MKEYKMWIGGNWVDARSGKTYISTNPATGEQIGKVPLGDREDARLAIQAARKAFPEWKKVVQADRSRKVQKLSDLMMEHADALAQIETADHGMPIKISSWMEIPVTSQTFEYSAQISRSLLGELLPCNPSEALTYVQREPLGVCSIITPWNWPLLMAAWKLAPALAAGNTCVIKPPSICSLGVLMLGELIEKLDLPKGTVNIITGPGGSVGQELASHPDVDRVAFTGSTETGQNIMSCCSPTTKRVGLELGGKNPFIVLADANIDAAVEGAVWGTFFNSGQVCSSASRYYIHERVYDEFVDKFVAVAKKLVMGDPMDFNTGMGPIASEEQMKKVEGYIKIGQQEGAHLVYQGIKPDKAPFNKGYFVPPTIFKDVTQNMRIAREEIFGPVAPIIKFSDKDDIVALANDNNYGLSASVWTANAFKAVKYANELQAGFVWVNDHAYNTAEMPWGGFKASGIGKDNSVHAFDEFTQLKTIHIDLSEQTRRIQYVLVNP